MMSSHLRERSADEGFNKNGTAFPSPRPTGRSADEGPMRGTTRLPQTRSRARLLREKETDAERNLWSRLRRRQVLNAKFRRQHPLFGYIVDFCCLERRLVVELDGGHHMSTTDDDQKRTQFLETRGFRVSGSGTTRSSGRSTGFYSGLPKLWKRALTGAPHLRPLPAPGRGKTEETHLCRQRR